jgi:hypothetical protein
VLRQCDNATIIGIGEMNSGNEMFKIAEKALADVRAYQITGSLNPGR